MATVSNAFCDSERYQKLREQMARIRAKLLDRSTPDTVFNELYEKYGKLDNELQKLLKKVRRSRRK